jgi:hypothetical protein
MSPLRDFGKYYLPGRCLIVSARARFGSILPQIMGSLPTKKNRAATDARTRTTTTHYVALLRPFIDGETQQAWHGCLPTEELHSPGLCVMFACRKGE